MRIRSFICCVCLHTFMLFSVNITMGVQQNNFKQNVKNNILKNMINDGEEWDSYDTNYIEPWQFREVNPTLPDFTENHELLWTVSAGQLIRMLDPKVYNRLQAPGQIFGVPTKVEVAMYVESMSTFRAQTMDFEVDTYLMLSWQDIRLMHNSTYPILLSDWNLANRMWHPDLYFVNAKFSYMHRVTTPNFMVLVYQDGYVLKTMRLDVTLACMLDLHDFPMDIQNCSAVIQSYAFIKNVLQLYWHTSGHYPIIFNPNIKINDMDLITVINMTCDSDYPLFRGKGRWSCLEATITMKRKLNFHVFQVFIPAAMLVIISWLSFWLHIKASPARISLTITTLLTLTTMSNGSRQELPHVPYMKANDIWFTVCQGFVFSVLLEYTIVNLFLGWQTSARTELRLKPTSNFRNFNSSTLESDSSKRIIINRANWEQKAKLVDNVSKILFPACFTIFVVVFWSVFVKR